jgi:single-strand DNA-binding protein
MNVVVVKGRLARPARCSVAGDDRLLVSWEVSTQAPGQRAEPVPAVWYDAPAWAADLDVGAEVAVLGRVRRRFFSAGGQTQSRTEVVVTEATSCQDTQATRALLAQARRSLAAT